LIIIMYCSADR